jgi:hypothetical protein
MFGTDMAVRVVGLFGGQFNANRSLVAAEAVDVDGEGCRWRPR